MKAEIENIASEIKQSLELLRRHLDWDNALRRLDELNALAEDPNLWNDQSKAQKLMQERTHLDGAINDCKLLSQDLDDTLEMIELGEIEGDDDIVVEAESHMHEIKAIAAKKELESLLSGEADSNDCFIEINAGAGGTEAQDWAEMLVRMYYRWSEQHGYKVEYIEESLGEEAGIKSVCLRISGQNAYGWMKTESGVHRLVRMSPFNAQGKRQTSFASVWVYPSIDDDIDIEINEKDCRIDTYRASGAGGQHINKTDSAVRITHIPTNIVVQCQSQRSQHKNREHAWKMLRARLYEAELHKREEASQAEHDSKTDIGWGNQIRSYVFQPYQMVKDLRTNAETANIKGVMDGDLDMFMEASLASKAGGEG
ncbi:MAG: peptide chain release factor 2 [Alphaproteobacteria bacterium]|nr:peptide chain release factor 2 [Alphaproteobacteria bacterium]